MAATLLPPSVERDQYGCAQSPCISLHSLNLPASPCFSLLLPPWVRACSHPPPVIAGGSHRHRCRTVHTGADNRAAASATVDSSLSRLVLTVAVVTPVLCADRWPPLFPGSPHLARGYQGHRDARQGQYASRPLARHGALAFSHLDAALTSTSRIITHTATSKLQPHSAASRWRRC